MEPLPVWIAATYSVFLFVGLHNGDCLSTSHAVTVSGLSTAPRRRVLRLSFAEGFEWHGVVDIRHISDLTFIAELEVVHHIGFNVDPRCRSRANVRQDRGLILADDHVLRLGGQSGQRPLHGQRA